MQNKTALFYGAIYGIATVVLLIVFWLIDPKFLLNQKYSFVRGLVLGITFIYISINSAKLRQEGYLSFGEGLVSSMVTYVIGTFLIVTFTYILYNFIDPNILILLKEKAMEDMEYYMNLFGNGNEEVLEEAREKMEEELESMNQLSVAQSIGNLLVYTILCGLPLSLIMSAILKKNP